MTDRYAVIGKPIAHSKSPLIHSTFAELTGQDIEYTKIEGTVEGFERIVSDFRSAGGRGMNVTAPFKLQAYEMGDVEEPHLVGQQVAANVRVLCAAPAYLKRRGHPKTLADLARHDCLLYRERHQTFGVWRLTGPHGAESVKVVGPMGSNHSDIVRNWALDGRGITLLAGWDVAAQLRDGSMERVLPAYSQQADVWAVTPARLDNSVKLRVCVEFLIRHLRQGPHALDTSIR